MEEKGKTQIVIFLMESGVLNQENSRLIKIETIEKNFKPSLYKCGMLNG